MAEIADELRKACSGHPHAKIAWPHRLLHRAADELDAKDKRIAELEAALRLAAPHHQGGHSEVGGAIADALGFAFPIRCNRDGDGNWWFMPAAHPLNKEDRNG